ncbi:MAG: hypothetical protein HQ495_04055 [Alphaproteobacteria bacterium]|nr:hypothetical protein [Alphaproteobacteria bacterium]
MAKIPTRGPRVRDPASTDPPWVDDERPSRDPPPPIEPDWANDTRPGNVAPEPYEPTWAMEQPAAAAPPRSDPPWAAQSVVDNDAALRAALAETPPPDPPWATVAATPKAAARPIDPPWVEDVRADTKPPPPIEPSWASAADETAIDDPPPADPPWVNDPPIRPPVILRGPIDPPWVPDDVSEAIAAEEKAARAAFEPSWVDDVAPPSPVPGALFDPGWESTPIAVPLLPMEPDWANEIDEADDDFAAAFDPGWEETAPQVASVPLPPMEPSWAIEVQSEVEQARSDIFEAPLESDGPIVAPDKMSILKGAQRLRGIVAQASLNPFGRGKRKRAARQIDREKLIADAMRIRTETREALGEETVNALYRSIMGTDPPEDER